MNEHGELAFEEALERLDEAEARMRTLTLMTADILIDLQAGLDVRPQLDGLLDLLLACRRAMSQAAGWIDKTMLELDRERRYDDTGAGTERPR